MTMASLTLMLMTAAELSLDVSAEVPCVTSASLDAALAQRGVRVTKATASMLNVKVRGDATRISLSGSRGSQKFERSVPVAKGDCDAVTRVTLALLESWATTSRVSVVRHDEVDAGVAGSPVVDAGVASERIGTTAGANERAALAGQIGTTRGSSAVDAGVANERIGMTADANERAALVGQIGTTRGSSVADAGVANEGTSLIDAGIEPEPLAERAVAVRIGTTPGTSRVDAGVATEPTARVAEPAPLSLEVIVLGGVAYEPLHPLPGSQVTTATGQLALRGAIGRWGLLLDGGFDSARSNTVSTAIATGSTQWLSLSLSIAFQPLERLSFDIALGVRGWRLAASATGVDAPSDQTYFTGGGVFSAGLNFQLIGPLHLQLRPWTSLRVQRVHFTVPPLGPILPIEPWTLGVLAGALLRFD